MENQAIASAEKKTAALSALEYVKEGMVLSLGTGSTAEIFIHLLADQVDAGLQVQAVCSSIRTEKLAGQLGIPLISIDKVQQIDLAVDGADAIDKNHVLIKGGGGALLREKILAYASNSFVVIADSSKYSENLTFPILPVEILPFAYPLTIKALEKKGFNGKIRKINNDIFITDNGHYIFDVTLSESLNHPEKMHAEIISVPGVLETGLFFLTDLTIILGKKDGSAMTVAKGTKGT